MGLSSMYNMIDAGDEAMFLPCQPGFAPCTVDNTTTTNGAFFIELNVESLGLVYCNC